MRSLAFVRLRTHYVPKVLTRGEDSRRAGADRNALRYAVGGTPTSRTKWLRSTVGEPNPTSPAMRSIDTALDSSSSCARRTRALATHAAGVMPTCVRKWRLTVRVLRAARFA